MDFGAEKPGRLSESAGDKVEKGDDMAEEKMNARDRILLLADPGSFVELGARIEMRATDFGTSLQKEAGDGVITGYATVGGKLVYIYSQDASVLNGSIGEMHARKIAHLYELAMKMGSPIVGMLDSSGLRLEEVTDALEGFGFLYRTKSRCSGVVPQISMIFGKCGGGLAVLAALSDFVYMTEDARLFVNAPNTLPGNTREKLDTASAEFQAAESGIVDGRGSATEITGMVRDLLSVLPANNEWPAEEAGSDDLNRLTPELQGQADAGYIAQVISDGHFLLEVKEEYAPEMAAGFIVLDGATAGFIGNRKETLTARGLRKAAAFVNFCDAFEIPLLTLTNVSGYEAGVEEEKQLAKASSEFALAIGSATVPKINVILNATGSAYVLMNSKALGADVVYAYEDAKIEVMNAESASKIIGGDDLGKVAEAFDEKQSALSAAKRGYVDELITPDTLRKHVLAAFEMLYGKRESVFRKHSGK